MKSGVDRRFLNARILVNGTANDAISTRAYDQWIVGSAPTGNFVSFPPNAIAYREEDSGDWMYLPAIVGDLEVVNISTKMIERFDGANWVGVLSIGGEGGSDAWAAPVEALAESGTELPAIGSHEVGDKFLDTATKKVHTVVSDGAEPPVLSWDAGVAVQEGERFASSTDGKIYTLKAGVLEAETLSDGAAFIDKHTDTLWAYDQPTDTFKAIAGAISNIPTASYTVLGGVSIKKDGGLLVNSGVLSVNRITGTVYFTLTQDHLDTGMIPLPYQFTRGLEAHSSLTVQGVSQAYGDGLDYKLYPNEVGGNTDALVFEGGGSPDDLLSIMLPGDVLALTYTFDPVIPGV